MLLLCKKMFPSGCKIFYVLSGQVPHFPALPFLNIVHFCKIKVHPCFTKSLEYPCFIESNKVCPSVQGVTIEPVKYGLVTLCWLEIYWKFLAVQALVFIKSQEALL